MSYDTIKDRGLVLLGCGKMGGAMLQGWLANDLPPSSVYVVDPFPADWLNSTGVHINAAVPTNPAVLVVAVKPQMMGDALPDVAALGGGETLVVSIAAGTTISHFEDVFGPETPIIRAMPNTPAAVGQGITALIGNDSSTAAQLDTAEALLAAVGKTVRLTSEDQMDAVTAVSGSGPAYVFHLIETMAAAGEAEGLPADLAMELALTTVAGAGALAEQSEDTPTQLRINVTSPNGTTQAALEVLMDETTGFPDVVTRGVAAAANRSRELGK
ncbi:MAG: pyrroline-5-carboxylate reductase [Boseongicola sp.]|nr:pyrroline-5-carboxylate reductase [Boseongicola sp.]MDD9979440.1 pyrroline-5-carboxylate reductase [Boseongicola sp.]